MTESLCSTAGGLSRETCLQEDSVVPGMIKVIVQIDEMKGFSEGEGLHPFA